jgi:hypothetical protein
MLGHFERLMEQAVEGSLRHVFHTALQPIQLAKAAARAMEQGMIIGVRGAEAPNVYELHLAPSDFSRFNAHRELIVGEIQTYLLDYARERGMRPVARIRVELTQDGHVREGSVFAEARFGDLTPAVQNGVDAAIEGTRRLRLADLAAAQPQSKPSRQSMFVLSDGQGLQYELDPHAGVVRLGRATDNDVAVDSQRVSRYHCQLRWVDTGWLVYDLDSTNGTWLDGRRVEPGRPGLLRTSSELRLGDTDFKVVSKKTSRGRR